MYATRHKNYFASFRLLYDVKAEGKVSFVNPLKGHELVN